MQERASHAIDPEVIETVEAMQFGAFVDGWIAATGVQAGVSVLEHRLNAAEAYNALHGTDHMGEMLRRHATPERVDA